MLHQKLLWPLTEAERLTLEEMGRHHPFADCRFRARGILSLDAKCKPGLIAQVLGVSEPSVYNWAKWWKAEGLAGLLGGHKGGRPVKLTAELVESACDIAMAEALTLAGIKQRVYERHPDAPNFSVDRLGVRLKERRLSFKRCRLSLKKKRPEQEFARKKAVLDRLKERATAGCVRLFFLDESGMSTVPNVQRAWSPLGQPHSADAGISKKRVNILGALDYAANMLTHVLQDGSVKRTHVIDFIDRLAAQSQGDKLTIVVLDNASIHHHIDTEKIRAWRREHKLILFHLPSYSPELNLIEILWKQAKYQWRKFTSWTKQNLFSEVNDIFCSYGEKFKINYA